ncbi:MAG TPA: SCO family protein [Rhizobiaceae bacterium]|nr:SCO family protein [Rhizobiaceae bacterium]
MGRTLLLLACILLSAAVAQGHEQAAGEHTVQVTGPADNWVYPLADPGTYALPEIGKAANFILLAEYGTKVSLSQLYTGKVTLLAFVYTRCGDVCPMASAYMAQVRQLSGSAGLSGVLGMISLSFDPQYDTPARMREYAEGFRTEDPSLPPWRFLTAGDETAIAPVLSAYGQPVSRKREASSPSGPLSHLLRVFLIDAGGSIRNIYSADFLDPRLVINDVLTLRLASPK